jgi:hypothetical protein
MFRWLVVSLGLLWITGCGGSSPGEEGRQTEEFALANLPLISLQEGEKQRILLTALGADGESVTFSLHGAPSYATIDESLLTLAPVAGDAGDATFTVEASTGKKTASSTLTVRVRPLPATPNLAPRISTPWVFNPDGSAILWRSQPPPAGYFSKGMPTLQGVLEDPDEEAVRLLVEVRLSGEPLTGVATHQTELLPHKTLAKVPLTGLTVGQKYVLKLKAEDARGAATTWGGLLTELTIGEP